MVKHKNFSRDILKCDFEEGWSKWPTDSNKGISEPAPQKPHKEGKLIDLVDPSNFEYKITLQDAIKKRRSRRKFNKDSLNLEQLSFLLWSTQGVTDANIATHRAVPSASARHPFETYLGIRRVKGVEPGIYRYLPLEHKLYLVSDDKEDLEELSNSCFEVNTPPIRSAAVVFIWTAMAYRGEWRFGPYAYKLIAMDAGHLCQNLYLAVQAIDAGACAVAAYDQKRVDRLVGANGHDEFAIYLATVGGIS